MHRLLKRVLEAGRRLSLEVENRFDHLYLSPDVPIAGAINHHNWFRKIVEIGNHPGMRILEIGSREVTAQSNARDCFSQAEYVGFDFYPGANVDVVGDVHRLSSHFDEASFDVVYSSACFEHFAMPWTVATEIARVLKVGGHVFVETHFSFSSHERPWHFFQFSDMALRVLFPDALGFECIEAGMSNPMVGRFSIHASPYLRNQPIVGLYCHSEFLGRKVRDVRDFDWRTVEPSSVVGETRYPAPKTP